MAPLLASAEFMITVKAEVVELAGDSGQRPTLETITPLTVPR